MTQDTHHSLTEQSALSDARAGEFRNDPLEGIPEGDEPVIDVDTKTAIWKALTEQWVIEKDTVAREVAREKEDDEDAQNTPVIAKTDAVDPRFDTAEKMRTYYENERAPKVAAESARQKVKAGYQALQAAILGNDDENFVSVVSNELDSLIMDTPDLDLSPVPMHPGDTNIGGRDEENQDTRIQSLIEQIPSKRWNLLSKSTRRLIDSMVVQRYGRNHLDNVRDRSVVAGMIMGEVNDVAKTYHEWLIKAVTEIMQENSSGESVDEERVIETCKLLLLQEVDADLNA